MLASRAGLHHTHLNTPRWTSRQPGCKSHVFRRTGWFCGWFRWTLGSHPPWWRGAGPGGWCRRAWAWPAARCRGAADTPSRHRSLQREGDREGVREDISRTLRTFPAQQRRCHTCSTWCCVPAGRGVITKERSLWNLHSDTAPELSFASAHTVLLLHSSVLVWHSVRL